MTATDDLSVPNWFFFAQCPIISTFPDLVVGISPCNNDKPSISWI